MATSTIQPDMNQMLVTFDDECPMIMHRDALVHSMDYSFPLFSCSVGTTNHFATCNSLLTNEIGGGMAAL